jgi:tetratricopeptide (TPR) repeat protein
MKESMQVRLFALLLSSVAAFAQTGTLAGTAIDAKRQPIAGARIDIQAQAGRKLQSLRTDAQGKFTLALNPGTYTIKAEDDALEQAAAGPVTISVGKPFVIELVLKPQYFDEPRFVVAGVTDNTYRGGHGSGAVLRSAEALAKQTEALATEEPSGDPLQTVAKLRSAAEADPSEPNLFNWGTDLLAHRAFEAAEQVFTEGARLFPHSTRMLLGLGSAQYAGGRYDAAAGSFFKAADLDPADPKPYLFLDQIERREIIDLPAYGERLRRFAEIHPESAAANYDYGIVLWRRQDREGAVKYLQHAIRLDPRLSDAHLQLGRIDAAGGNYTAAISEYRKAIEIDPDLEEAHYGLYEAYRITGDRPAANEELTRYKQLSALSSAKLEQERRRVLQFVISLKNQ